MATRTWQGISLCSGGGGLDLGLRIATDARVVCYVEREAPATALLVARIQDGSLDDAPIWSDLATFDGRPWRGRVDIVSGGFPCQPFSVAGQQQGADDERNLWPEVRRIIGEVGPSVVFLENVPGILRYYHDTIRPELQGLGYRVEETLLKASDVGAPHGRERLFILGVDDSRGPEWGPDAFARACRIQGHDGEGQASSGLAESGEGLGHAGRRGGERLGGHGRLVGTSRASPGDCGQRQRLRDAADDTEPDVGHADEPGSQGRRDGRSERADEQVAWPGSGDAADADDAPTTRRGGVGGTVCLDSESNRPHASGGDWPPFPPGPDDLDAWAHVLAEMPALEPALCRVADGVADSLDLSRAQRLSILGNGVVPLQAAVAFTALWRRQT